MMEIKPEETELIGKVLNRDGKIIFDKTSERIDYLIKNYLVRIATDESGWNALYQDPEDKRYWEKINLQSEMHGGGPPSLMNINEEEANRKYKF